MDVEHEIDTDNNTLRFGVKQRYQLKEGNLKWGIARRHLEETKELPIHETKRTNQKPIYAHLSLDAKAGLDALAKYHRTTLTNLIEEGARLVIHNHIKQIRNNNAETQHLKSYMPSASDW